MIAPQGYKPSWIGAIHALNLRGNCVFVDETQLVLRTNKNKMETKHAFPGEFVDISSISLIHFFQFIWH